MRLKRTTKQLIAAILGSFIVAGTAFLLVYFIILGQVKETYQKQLDEANNLIEVNQQYAFVAKEPIPKGSTITEEKLNYEQIFTGLTAESYISKTDFGKIAVVNIENSTPILKNMITEDIIDNDVREEEFNVFYLSSNLKENDYIDIRIIYPNGEDYSVLSKKAVKDLSLENSICYLWLNAEELLRISGAIVDSYLHEGSKLYTVKYIEPLVQEATKVTYVPNEDVIRLIKSDPNIVKIASERLSEQIRRSLDDRLMTFYQNYDGQVAWDKVSPQAVENMQINDDINASVTQNPEESTNENEEGVFYVE